MSLQQITAQATVFVLFAAGMLAAGSLAWAETSPATVPESAGPKNPRDLSDFEWRMVEAALDTHGLELITDDEAAGKTVEEIVVVTDEVFTDADLYPNWFNAFHMVSKEHVIAREVLLQPGEVYVPELAAESGRNLRAPQVLTVAQVLPVRGDSDETIKLLVVTKDLWSLRTNFNFLIVGDVLDFLTVSFSETNFLGLHKRAGLVGLLEQDTLSVGEFVVDPRVWGSRITASESAYVIFNRDSGAIEGFRGSASVGRPLFSLREKWGWQIAASGITEIGRFFQGADLHVYDDPDTEDVEAMPFVWRRKALELDVSGVRSFGLHWKQNLTAGYQLTYDSFEYGESDRDQELFGPELVRSFEDRFLPRSERVSAVYGQYEFFEANYLSLRNYETYALPEDFRFGPQFVARLTHAEPGIGSSVRFQRMRTSGVMRWLLFDDAAGNPSRNGDIFAIGAGYGTRIEDGELVDNEVDASVRNYSPVFLAGRLVLQGSVVYRYDDLSNSTSTLGAGSGLRGYPSAVFFGASRVAGHVEWRTLPLEFYTFHLGGAAFYDTGGIADRGDWSDLSVYHGTGLGLRLLNPAGNRIVMRADWGIPLTPVAGLATWPGEFTFGFEQAF